jgi:hypothetical protein
MCHASETRINKHANVPFLIADTVPILSFIKRVAFNTHPNGAQCNVI